MLKFNDYYQLSEKPELQGKWETILFTGDYNPITRDEYNRITQFMQEVILKEEYSPKFEEDVELGVIIDHDSSTEKETFNQRENCELMIEERKFINEKLFGLKTIPINLTELLFMVHSNDDEQQLEETKSISKELNKKFHNSNILIVLRPEEKMFINEFEELKPHFTDNNLNIGFMVFEHQKYIAPEPIHKTPCSGDIIKSLILLNSENPHPEAIRFFAHKYKIQDSLDYIRNLRNRFEGNYEQVFEYLFPSLKINENEEKETTEANVKTIMEFLRRMYIKVEQ